MKLTIDDEETKQADAKEKSKLEAELDEQVVKT